MTHRLAPLCFSAFILLACNQNLQQPTPGILSVPEARNMVENYHPIIVDVRTPEEVKAGAIAGTLFIDIKAEDFSQKISELDKAGTYLVYCKKGGRSARAVNIMNKMGFSKVYDLEGGYDEWLIQK